MSIVVVGAGLAGLRSAEALRAAGYRGELVVVGDEPHWPYSRPPLSKTALAEGLGTLAAPDLSRVELRRRRSVADVQWLLGRPVVASSLGDHTVTLDGGQTLRWDGLVIATGLRARRLDLLGGVPLRGAGRHALRSVEDAIALRADLRPGARLVVIGAGFLGCEVTATAAALGCRVDVVAPEAEPMERALGPLVGGALRQRHEAAGVRFHLGRLPSAVEAGSAGQVAAVVLDDGQRLPADVVLEAVGAAPSTVGWLDGNGLDLGDGVLCDGWMRVLTGSDGEGRPDVVAVGDVARFPLPLAGGPPRRIEHWDLPQVTARRAAPALLAGISDGERDPAPFDPIPSFWSDQYDITIQTFGVPEVADDVEVVDGDVDGPFVAAYRKGGRLVAVVGVGTMAGVMELRARVGQGPPQANVDRAG